VSRLLDKNLSSYGLVKDDYRINLTFFLTTTFSENIKFIFWTICSRCRKTRLGVFVLILQNLRGWSNIYSDRSKLWLIQHWRTERTIRLRTTTVHFFHHCEWLLRQHEYGHFLTYGHFMSRPTAFHCQTPELYWHFVIWLTSLKEIQTQFLSPRLFVHVPQYS
jgi:hypothetical protein